MNAADLLNFTPDMVEPSWIVYYSLLLRPFQISMIASIYTTIALALERYLSIRSAAAPTRSFPCRVAAAIILVFSFAINAPRFFELRPVMEEKTTYQVRKGTNDKFFASPSKSLSKPWTLIVFRALGREIPLQGG